jgi:hypothetical protein
MRKSGAPLALCPQARNWRSSFTFCSIESMKADFEFTLEFSTSVFTCVGPNCERVVEPGAKILFVNGHQRDFCAGCARPYLRSLIKNLRRIQGCTYAICDNTASASLRLIHPFDVIEEKDIDSFLLEIQENI